MGVSQYEYLNLNLTVFHRQLIATQLKNSLKYYTCKIKKYMGGLLLKKSFMAFYFSEIQQMIYCSLPWNKK